jgi:DNA repair photolyase
MIGCDFCYAAHRADLSRALGGLPELPWGRYVDVKVNAAEVLRREVTQHPPGVVRMSPIVTDPYQPLERRFRITRQCLEVLLEAGFTPLVLTRAARVLDDVDLLARFPRAAVGLSVPTDDDAIRRIFEPGGDPIDERLDALARCRAAGIRTFGVIQPMLPMNPARLVEQMAPHVTVVRIDRMHELSRSRAHYEAAGRLDASEDAFFERTGAELRAGFTAAGVAVDDRDDLGGALGLV